MQRVLATQVRHVQGVLEVRVRPDEPVLQCQDTVDRGLGPGFQPDQPGGARKLAIGRRQVDQGLGHGRPPFRGCEFVVAGGGRGRVHGVLHAGPHTDRERRFVATVEQLPGGHEAANT